MPSGTVLVVDDTADVREITEALLSGDGLHVLLAENGEAALARLREAAEAGDVPCCILLDLTMPVMDGWTFHKHLLADERFAKIPVIVMTASTMPPPRDVAEVLYKPIEPLRLLGLVRSFCGGGER